MISTAIRTKPIRVSAIRAMSISISPSFLNHQTYTCVQDVFWWCKKRLKGEIPSGRLQRDLSALFPQRSTICMQFKLPLSRILLPDKISKFASGIFTCWPFFVPPLFLLWHTFVTCVAWKSSRVSGFPSRPTLPKIWSFKIHRTTFRNYIQLADLLILRL